MRRLLARRAPAVLLAVMAVACATQSDGGWTSQEVAGVAFDHPSAWVVYEGGDTRVDDALIEVVDRDNNGVAVYRYRNDGGGVAEMTEGFQRELRAIDGELLGEEPATVHGAPDAVLLRAELDYDEDGTMRTYRLSRLLVELDDAIVEVRGREPAGADDRTLEAVLASVRVAG